MPPSLLGHDGAGRSPRAGAVDRGLLSSGLYRRLRRARPAPRFGSAAPRPIDAAWLVGSPACAGPTTGRELHPAPKALRRSYHRHANVPCGASAPCGTPQRPAERPAPLWSSRRPRRRHVAHKGRCRMVQESQNHPAPDARRPTPDADGRFAIGERSGTLTQMTMPARLPARLDARRPSGRRPGSPRLRRRSPEAARPLACARRVARGESRSAFRERSGNRAPAAMLVDYPPKPAPRRAGWSAR